MAEQYDGFDRTTWDTRRALTALDDERRSSIPALAEQAERAKQPMDEKRRVQRLTALGMVMAPNRPSAEASMWVREVSRLLADIAEDVLCDAIDDLQKRMKFLPTVAEIRELADPVMEQRRLRFARLDAMRRYLEASLPLTALPPPERPRRNVMDHRGKPMTEEETAELNQILENLGAISRYRPDGSKYDVAKREPAKQEFDRPQMPTRADYISWGVDPAVLDQIEAEKMAKNTTSSTT